MMIERVPEGIRSDVRSLVASDMGAMSTPMNVAQAIATAVGMKLLSGNTTKKTTTTATAPKAQRQVGPTASPTGASATTPTNRSSRLSAKPRRPTLTAAGRRTEYANMARNGFQGKARTATHGK